MKYFVRCLKKYAVFKGRANRAEYWVFLLFSLIINAIFIAIDISIGWQTFLFEMPLLPLYEVSRLALLIPGISVLVRRLHDINKSGWWAFLWLAPIVGWILLFVWTVKISNKGENIYDLIDDK